MTCYHLTQKELDALIRKHLPLRVLGLLLNKWEGHKVNKTVKSKGASQWKKRS